MVTESLINYIKNQNSKNVPNELIISQLIKVGWHMEDIEEGIAKATPLVLDKVEIQTPSIPKEEVKKDYSIDPYHESTKSLSEDSSLIKIRGFKKEEFVKEEPSVEIQKEESPKIWTPTAIKSVEETKIEIEQPIIKPVSTRNLEAFQPELGKPEEPIKSNFVNPINKEIEPLVKKEENEMIPNLISKTKVEPSQGLSWKTSVDPQPQPDNKTNTPKIENIINPIETSDTSSFLNQKKITNNTKDMSKLAMISSYSDDYMSANKLKQEVYKRRKNTLLKSLLIILIICILGGVSFSVVRGYIKIPDFNFSFIKKDSKLLLLESVFKFNSLKSYKVETEATISFPSFTSITSGLLTGESVNSKEEDYFTLFSKGEITKLESSSKFYDYSIALKSSILEKDIKTNIKTDGVRFFVDIPDLSPIFKDGLFLEGVVSLSSDQIVEMAILLPESINDKEDKEDLLEIVLRNFIKNDPDKSSFSFESLADNIEMIKKDQEIISNINTDHYIVNLDKIILKDFLSKTSFVLLNNLTEEEKSDFDKIWNSVSIKSLEVWIGEKDNNIYRYKFSLSVPLSKIIGLEDKSISNKEVILDWQTTFSDLDVPNSVIVPIANAMSFDDFSKKVADLKIKNAVFSLVSSTGEIKKVLGNYGLKLNTMGSCTNPVSGSLFSPLGHTKNASTIVAKIANTMNLIVAQTGENSKCFSSSKAWAVSVSLASDPNTYFCLDSAGNSLDLKGPINKTSCK